MHRKWWTLLVVSVATFMLLLDITVVNTALPAIQKDLGATFTELQWVIDAYTLALAALVLSAGVLADRLGRRRVFGAGLAIFTVASALAGLAPDPTFLNVTRAVQGIGGAVMFAVSLALVAQEFKPGRDRGVAMGVYGATIGARRGLRAAGGRCPGGGDRLGVDLLPERPVGIVALVITYTRLRGVARPERVAHRLGRTGHLLHRAVPARVRAAARQRGGLGLDPDRRRCSPVRCADGHLHRDRERA